MATSTQVSSYGRGGAGNMIDTSDSPRLQPSDLETPTLKRPVVTTGRGGTGNMAKNTDPEETRILQDVEAAPKQDPSTPQHSGRGGAGNIVRNESTVEQGKADQDNTEEGVIAPGPRVIFEEQTPPSQSGSRPRRWLRKQ